MKTILVLFSIVIMVIVLVGADIRRKKVVAPIENKKPCYGYTIIEFGKGINCDGDTVKLRKVNGGQILAQH